MGTPAPPQRKKIFRRNLPGKFVSAPPSNAPQTEQESNFRTSFLLGGGDLEVGVVYLVVLDRLLRATTKKSQLF